MKNLDDRVWGTLGALVKLNELNQMVRDDTDRNRTYEDTDSMKYDTATGYQDREELVRECERIQVSEWPVLCKDGSTKILVVMSDRYTGEILHMFRKEDDIKECPSSVYGSTKDTRDMLRKAELNARYGKAVTDGEEAN